MARVFDRIVIAVPDMPRAVEEYGQIFGFHPAENLIEHSASTAWWGLPNTVIEIRQSSVDKPRIQGIVLNLPEESQEATAVENLLGLNIHLGNGSQTSDFRRSRPGEQIADPAVDHLVLYTDDAEACIELFAGRLGIRLALDQTVPEWGGRMLFFRAGKLTLEVIQSDTGGNKGSYFGGIAYQCKDIELFSRELAARGVALSEIRDGRKPGTRVATVRNHCLGIPTLLIQPSK